MMTRVLDLVIYQVITIFTFYRLHELYPAVYEGLREDLSVSGQLIHNEGRLPTKSKRSSETRTSGAGGSQETENRAGGKGSVQVGTGKGSVQLGREVPSWEGKCPGWNLSVKVGREVPSWEGKYQIGNGSTQLGREVSRLELKCQGGKGSVQWGYGSVQVGREVIVMHFYICILQPARNCIIV